MYVPFFGKKAKTSEPVHTLTWTEELRKYELLRCLAQDAVDISEKWSKTQTKTLGKAPTALEKKSMALTRIVPMLIHHAVVTNEFALDFVIEAAVGNNSLTRSDKMPITTIFEEGSDDLGSNAF